MRLIPRAYQIEAASGAIAGNTVINVCTGGGKTLIAVIVINDFILKHPSKVVCFLVPSRALVSQQAAYLRLNCDEKEGKQLLIEEISGQEIELWGQHEWTEIMTRSDVVVGTPEVFRKAFVEKSFITPSQFSLIVFDECHNAVGNSPMASIMRDAVLKLPPNQRPRILGLTASFANGSTANVATILKKRAALEVLFQASILSPIVPAEAENSAVENKFSVISYLDDNLGQYEVVLKNFVKKVLSIVPFRLFEDLDNWVGKGWSIFATAGAEATRYWLSEGIIHQLMAKARELEKNSDLKCKRVAERIFSGIEQSRGYLSNIDWDPAMAVKLPKHSQQLLALFDLLDTLKAESTDHLVGDAQSKSVGGQGQGQGQGKAAFKGIIFVEQVALTYPLAHLINQHYMKVDDSDSNQCATCLKPKGAGAGEPTALPVSGTGSMLDAIRNQNLDSFRSGLSPILISTSALEEGIDVPDCSFVIRFDAFNTTKSHIQGSGRARCKHAKIFYFKNDPLLECSRAYTMDAIAKDKRLNLTAAEKKSEHEISITRNVRTTVQYPYCAPTPDPAVSLNHLTPSTKSAESAVRSGEVNFFNCMSIFYEYVAKVMRQSFDPEVLFEVEEQVVRQLPQDITTYLVSIVYPTPSGVSVLSSDDVDAYWGSTRVRDVVLPAFLLKKMSGPEIAKRRAIYVLVVHMSKAELLDCANEPTAHALSVCKSACPALQMRNRIKLSDRFLNYP